MDALQQTFDGLKRQALEREFSRMNDMQKKAVFQTRARFWCWRAREAARPLCW